MSVGVSLLLLRALMVFTYWSSEPQNVTLKKLICSSRAGNQTLGARL